MKNPTYSISTAFSKRIDGDMRSTVVLRSFLSKKKLPSSSYIAAEQTHGIQIARVNESRRGHVIPGVDGLILTKSDVNISIALVIRTADCMPIIAIDEKNGVFGIIHAGWKGTVSTIGASLIQTMESLGSQSCSISILVGPHIHQCCYVVDINRSKAFQKIFGREVIQEKGKEQHLSLLGSMKKQLVMAGITPESIRDSDICTSCACNEYFSYRKREQVSFGEQVGILAISRYN